MVYEVYDEKQNKLNLKKLMSLLVILQILKVNWHSKIMMIDHYSASINTHFHTSNMVAIFSDCTLGEPSLGHPNIITSPLTVWHQTLSCCHATCNMTPSTNSSGSMLLRGSIIILCCVPPLLVGSVALVMRFSYSTIRQGEMIHCRVPILLIVHCNRNYAINYYY